MRVGAAGEVHGRWQGLGRNCCWEGESRVPGRGVLSAPPSSYEDGFPFHRGRNNIGSSQQ